MSNTETLWAIIIAFAIGIVVVDRLNAYDDCIDYGDCYRAESFERGGW